MIHYRDLMEKKKSLFRGDSSGVEAQIAHALEHHDYLRAPISSQDIRDIFSSGEQNPLGRSLKESLEQGRDLGNLLGTASVLCVEDDDSVVFMKTDTQNPSDSVHVFSYSFENGNMGAFVGSRIKFLAFGCMTHRYAPSQPFVIIAQGNTLSKQRILGGNEGFLGVGKYVYEALVTSLHQRAYSTLRRRLN